MRAVEVADQAVEVTGRAPVGQVAVGADQEHRRPPHAVTAVQPAVLGRQHVHGDRDRVAGQHTLDGPPGGTEVRAAARSLEEQEVVRGAAQQVVEARPVHELIAVERRLAALLADRVPDGVPPDLVAAAAVTALRVAMTTWHADQRESSLPDLARDNLRLVFGGGLV